MSPKLSIEQFKQLSPATQIALVTSITVIVVLLAFFPAVGTNIVTFLIALKILITQRE